MDKNSTNSVPQTQRVGVIDIGSNSVRLVIYELFGASVTPIYNEKVLAGLGRSLKRNGKLYAPGAAQTFKALQRFKTLSQAHNLDELTLVATAAMRQAKDGAEFIERVKKDIGLHIICLSGEQEAQMAALGVIAGDSRAKGVVADLGGASLELIKVADGDATDGQTYPLGPFVMSCNRPDNYDPHYLRRAISKELSGIETTYSAHEGTLYLVGGAWRNLAIIHNKRTAYPLPILQGYDFRPEAAMALAAWAGENAAHDLMRWPGLSTRRAETLPYAALMLEALIEKLKPARIIVSASGVREGCIYHNLAPDLRSRDVLIDACQHLASGSEQGHDFGQPLFDWLGSAMPAFPSCFQPNIENRLRKAACFLVGMGKGLHPDHRASLVFNDVLYAPLAGLTHRERAYLALMLYASYTGAKTTPNDTALDFHLLEREKNSARIFGTAMRLGTVISARSPAILKYFSLSCDDKSLKLTVEKNAQSLFNYRIFMRAKSLANMAERALKSNYKDSSHI